ncbi:hypothetical protein GCM10010345_65290 [Streptomyces canarius]|uniref:Uncharacterized protein n=1 Tax=Streptomyces canarius TaxID=285453 RepID=A0ABQ3D3T6_9ACTN|nr:hypothetical protein GCM10010345_65290 [Streptomyces canarius]
MRSSQHPVCPVGTDLVGRTTVQATFSKESARLGHSVTRSSQARSASACQLGRGATGEADPTVRAYPC